MTTAKDLTVTNTLFTVNTKPSTDFAQIKPLKSIIKARRINKLKASVINGQPVVTAFWGNGEDDKMTLPLGRKLNENVSGCETIFTDPAKFKSAVKAMVDIELQDYDQIESLIEKRRNEIEDQMTSLDAIINRNV